MSLQKIIYLLWSDRDGDEARRVLLDDCAPALLEAGAQRLHFHVHDGEADETPSPAPKVLFETPVQALAHVYLDEVAERWPLEDVLRDAGFSLAGYHVEEQIYTEYGGNEHAPKRSWPDGERSPGILAVTMMERPRRLSKEAWTHHWHHRQSPMSEAMQPRCRYVRNVVLEQLTHGATPFEGIVEEAFPTPKHVKNLFLFYGAKNPLALVRNMAIMVRSVTAFLDLWRIRTLTMSEYFVVSDHGPPESR